MPSPLLSIRASHSCLKHQRLEQPGGRGPQEQHGADQAKSCPWQGWNWLIFEVTPNPNPSMRKVPKSLRALGRARSGSPGVGAVPVCPGKHHPGPRAGSKRSEHHPNNPPEPPLLQTSPFAPSTSTSPRPPEQLRPGDAETPPDRDVQQRAEDKETSRRHLNTKDGLGEGSLDRTGHCCTFVVAAHQPGQSHRCP